MKAMWVVVGIVLLAGCGELSKSSKKRREALAPSGIAPVVEPASEPEPADVSAEPAPAAKPTEPAETTAPEPADTPTPAPAMVTGRLVDARKALANPKIRAVDGKIEGLDPISQAASAYFSIRAKASLLGFQQEIRQIKEVEGRNVSFREFLEMTQRHRIQFELLRPYEMYGYDEGTGKIMVLEDTEAKAKLHGKQ